LFSSDRAIGEYAAKIWDVPLGTIVGRQRSTEA
jgi:hypothetical protein